MKLEKNIKAADIAAQIGAIKIIGDGQIEATGINEINNVQAGDITFCDHPKWIAKTLKSAATILIINAEAEAIEGKVILLHNAPFEAYDSIVRANRSFNPLNEEVSESADIHPSAIIEPGAIIGRHVRIGAGCYIQANAILHDFVFLGKNCRIGAGAILGTEAFYFKRTEGGYKKWRSGGKVILEDGVDIGAGCTVNLGVSSDTRIGAGTKIDCQVHIGHDVKIGKNCLIAAQTGISGNTIIEDDVTIYGQVGVAQNIRIGKGAIVLAKSGVAKSIEGNKTYFGYPAQEVREAYKELATLRMLKQNREK